MHRVLIQGTTLPGDLPVQKSRPYRRVGDNIAITTGQRGETRVELGAYRDSPVHAYIDREIGVATQSPGLGTALHRGVKVDYLAMTVHAGIGTSGAMHPHRSFGHLPKAVFQLLLDSLYIQMRLGLPTTVLAAIVLDTAGDAATRRQRVSGKRG